MARSTICTFDLLVLGGVCGTPWGLVEADVGVRDGQIAAIGRLSAYKARTKIDATGLHVLPGIIDSQVHFREPGLEHKEDLVSGTSAAALGGVTTVLEMPNTMPPTIDEAAFFDKTKRVSGRARVDVGFFIGACGENAAALSHLEGLPGCAGVKVFMGSSTGSLLVPDDHVLRRVLESGRRRVAVHAEDEERLRTRRHFVEGEDSSVALHPVWRDVASALLATRRVLSLARETRRRVHILHVTTAEEMALLAGHKDHATIEVTPQHLTLAAPACYEALGTRAQMNPPIRAQHHQNALWQAVATGLVDVVGSDHAPHSLSEKAAPYPRSPSGMPGVQTLLPLMLTHVNAGRLSLGRLIDLLCHAPARVYGIARKGRLAVGCHADLALVDLKRRVRLRDDMMATRVGWTPFDGYDVTGWPVATVLRGEIIMRDGELLGLPLGRLVDFEESRH